jgi:hypothetical protein
MIALIPTKIKLYFTLFLRVITTKDFKKHSRGGNECGYEHTDRNQDV